jgi:hypothetical protein
MIFQPKSVYVNLGTKKDPNWQWVTYQAPYWIENYLPDNGTPAALNADLIDPTSSSSGALGGETLALKFNVDYSAAGVLPNATGNFGALKYNNPYDASDYFNGKTVADILTAANTALGGGTPPTGYDCKSLAQLAQKLNGSFENGNVTGFALKYLRR